MTTTTDLDRHLATLRTLREALRKAREAAPGPWRSIRTVSGNGYSKHIAGDGPETLVSVGTHDVRCGGLHSMFASLDTKSIECNAAHIATWNPAFAQDVVALVEFLLRRCEVALRADPERDVLVQAWQEAKEAR